MKHGSVPVDLSNAVSVKFKMRRMNVDTLDVDGAGVVEDALTGLVSYSWLSGDTDDASVYLSEWEVTWNDGTVETFPKIGYETVLIQADLDGD